MKTQFIFIIFFIFSIANGQSYKPMVLPNNNWISTFFIYDMGGPNDIFYDYRFRFTGNDVVINDLTYKELEYRFRLREGSIDQPWGGDWTTASFYLRENIDEKKVWIYYSEVQDPSFPHEPGEFLLYDFSLGIGDPIPIEGFYSTFGDYGQPVVITDITYEDVDIPNINWQVKTFWLSVSNTTQISFVLYEGVGSSHGLINYDLTWDAGWELTAFNKVLSTNENKSSEIKVFPNPFKDEIKIDSDQEVEFIELYDSNGKLILKSNHSQSINTGFVSPGVYFLKLKLKNSTSEIFKLIKSN